ncbi:hypothetical protein DYB32_009707 [Aphanomyces invadans]|uniref:Uncharacterized protein n=1 Tax=Aphanomyces invadans TaxID=157072 RepID=A0A418AHW7_9STRA|nr:hypothetical protein DYB32_009707 [Aphanomyces invadans]
MSDTSDSDIVPSGMVSITTVTPPKLTSFSPEVLVKWTKKWEKFQRDLKMECVRMKRDYATALPSIQSLAEPAKLIEGMARFSWFVTMDEVNYEFILKKMKEIMSMPLNNAIPNAENALEKLRWNTSEKDVTMRVVNFLIEASSLIEGNGLSEDLKNDKMQKKIFSVILSKVKPATLRASLTERSDKQPEQELSASDEETKRPANINDVPLDTVDYDYSSDELEGRDPKGPGPIPVPSTKLFASMSFKIKANELMKCMNETGWNFGAALGRKEAEHELGNVSEDDGYDTMLENALSP